MSVIKAAAQSVFVSRVAKIINRWILHRMGVELVLAQTNLSHQKNHSYGQFYSNPKHWQGWLNETGYRMYNDIILVMEKHGLSCDGKHVVDIGCGTGHLLLIISEKYNPKSFTGTEVNESAIAIARETMPNADIRHDNLLETRIEQKFDVIFCTEVLEHLAEADKALDNLLAITNGKGTILVTVPNGRTDTFFGHINFWSPESWEVFIKSNCQNHIVHTGPLPNCAKLFAIIEVS